MVVKPPVGVGWRLCLVVAGPAVGAWLGLLWVCGWRLWVGAWLAVVGGCVGGIATIGLRHAGDTPWRGVYGSKTPRWCGLAAVLGPRSPLAGGERGANLCDELGRVFEVTPADPDDVPALCFKVPLALALAGERRMNT